MDRNSKIGVIGAGSMGMGIAQVAATAGHEVYLLDNNKEAVSKALQKINHFLGRSVTKGRLTDQEAKAIFGRIYAIENMESMSDASLVIEAIIENLDIKKSVFEKLATIVSPSCIIASNTSSLSITSLASTVSIPERFIGLHFFNPAPLMKLVEVVPALQSSKAKVDEGFKLMENWGKIPVIAKDTPGFIVNRIARPYYSEALRILEENNYNCLTMDTAMKELGGFRMGPFELMDLIGNDVNFMVTESMWKAFYHEPRYKPSFTQKRMVEAGYLGRKSGKGYYDYQTETPIHEQMEIDRSGMEEIFERIVCMLVNEACDAHWFGNIDFESSNKAMKYGVNYPKGPHEWGLEMGLEKVKEKLQSMYDFYQEERYRTSPYLNTIKA